MSRLMAKILITLVTGFIIGLFIYYLAPKESFQYEKTLPKEPPSQLLNFFREKLFYDKRLLSTEHSDGYIYQEGIIKEPQTYISYVFSSTEKINEYYYSRLHRDEDNKFAYRNVNPNSYLEEIKEVSSYDLPHITIVDDVLTITTAEGKLKFEAIQSINDEKLDISGVDYVSLKKVNDESFYLNITEEKNGESKRFYLFIKQDLTDYQLIEKSDEAFENFMQTDQFVMYSHLFPPIDEEGVYLNFHTRDQVIDTINKKIITINREDYLSDDGKYVYLAGEDRSVPNKGLPEGKQSIQRLEDYLAGVKSPYMTFNLDYKAIKKASELGGIGTKVSKTQRKIVYFNEDLIIIHVTYDAAFFGIAGETNVVIDFHKDEKNPKIYILNLAAS